MESPKYEKGQSVVTTQNGQLHIVEAVFDHDYCEPTYLLTHADTEENIEWTESALSPGDTL